MFNIFSLFFVLFSSFETNIIIFLPNICGKITIQFTVLGFEPNTIQYESPPITNRPELQIISQIRPELQVISRYRGKNLFTQGTDVVT